MTDSGGDALVRNHIIRSDGWNANAPPTGWAGVILSDSANVEIVDDTFGSNNVGDSSGGTRAVFIYDETRDPLPMHNIYTHDNVLNGDRIQSCTSTGIACGWSIGPGYARRT
jgi:hypothetical protein